MKKEGLQRDAREERREEHREDRQQMKMEESKNHDKDLPNK